MKTELKNQVQLITYPDSLGGELKQLKKMLNTCFKDLFKGGIHILPPFPSSGDRGFAPLTYLEIEKEFGSWEDIKQLGEQYDILLDLMVNHISRKSDFFQDYLKNGESSQYSDLFLNIEKVFPNGQIQQDEIDKIFLRRKNPYSTYKINDQEKILWTTFGKENPSEQVDIDVKAKITKSLLTLFLENFKANNVKIIRLDAVGYVIKKIGTSCFFVESDIYQFMGWIKKKAESLGLELLPEVHSHYSIQNKLAQRGFWIYDFILPYLILEALVLKKKSALTEYLVKRPEKQFTMLDCHDGIPVKPDLDGLVSSKDARKIVDVCLERGANLSYVFSEKHKDADGFDVHQIRCSYYSMLNCNDNAYLSARALQFFTPGIPQVYYVGLLAGENYKKGVEKTGEGREINRQNFSQEEIEQRSKLPVVKRLSQLIKFRNEYPAFQGSFKVLDAPENQIQLMWEKDNFHCVLQLDLLESKSVITYADVNGEPKQYII